MLVLGRGRLIVMREGGGGGVGRRALSGVGRTKLVWVEQEEGEEARTRYGVPEARGRLKRHASMAGSGLAQQQKQQLQERPQVRISNQQYVEELFTRLMLPVSHATSVRAGFTKYVGWTMTSSLVGTASSVLSLQALLVAMGMSAAIDPSSSFSVLPVAATINWVLKDGLGQLGGILFASFANRRLDTDPKKWRFLSDAFLTTAVFLEATSPLIPGYFLPLASVANVLKNISWLSASATRAAIHRSFTLQENLGDVTAKAGSQTVLASFLGTGLGIGLTPFVGSDASSSLLATIFLLGGIQLFCSFRALQEVSLPTLNVERGWFAISSGTHLTPEEVGKLESVVPRASWFLENGTGRYSINAFARNELRNRDLEAVQLHIGPKLPEFCATIFDFRNALERCEKYHDQHLIRIGGTNTIQLLYTTQATNQDVLIGFIHAAKIAMILQTSAAKYHKKSNRSCSTTNGEIKPTIEGFENIMEAARQSMNSDKDAEIDAFRRAGWDIDHLFLEERRARVRVREMDDGDNNSQEAEKDTWRVIGNNVELA